MERVAAKEAAAKAIDKEVRGMSVGPDELNGMLEEKGSAALRQKVKLHSVLLRPRVGMQDLRAKLPGLDGYLAQYDQEFVDLAEVNMKYEGYIVKEREMVDKMNRLEEVRLHDKIDYQELQSLSAEAREKLTQLRPRTIGQASRISGVSPSDISVLLVYVGR